jgi:hypothetical protein
MSKDATDSKTKIKGREYFHTFIRIGTIHYRYLVIAGVLAIIVLVRTKLYRIDEILPDFNFPNKRT